MVSILQLLCILVNILIEVTYSDFKELIKIGCFERDSVFLPGKYFFLVLEKIVLTSSNDTIRTVL